ncbi:hypothetical protein [Carboxylicivirga marina]|uniref:hypothetical protein n=1 Tax=Carboxylicivirga marina TaxID=2800988 RepID=UPI002598E12D|nr:hypothetical protein [uncultured Carboxylicivirga sp.]
MKNTVYKTTNAWELNPQWDRLCISYFQSRDFLHYLQQHNPSHQTYYELYKADVLSAGAVVYSSKVNLLTFTKGKAAISIRVIGLPISISDGGLIGEKDSVNQLLNVILKNEKGLVLALNLPHNFDNHEVITMRFLPSIVIDKNLNDWSSYKTSLRSSYRRRLRHLENKNSNTYIHTGSCKAFDHRHYYLYKQTLQRSKTKLETLSLDFFKHLPASFKLNSCFMDGALLYWNIVLHLKQKSYFCFGGIDYSYRDMYHSYHNNLLLALKDSIQNKSKELDLGQTAEVAKTRLGGLTNEKRMFLYHHNKVIFIFLKFIRKLLSYNVQPSIAHVFNDNRRTVDSVLHYCNQSTGDF